MCITDKYFGFLFFQVLSFEDIETDNISLYIFLFLYVHISKREDNTRESARQGRGYAPRGQKATTITIVV